MMEYYRAQSIGSAFSGNITIPADFFPYLQPAVADNYGNLIVMEGAYSVINGKFNIPASVMSVVKYNSVDGVSIVDTNSTDSIYNVGSNVNISTGSSKDSIVVSGGYWDDTAQQYISPTKVTVGLGDGDDHIVEDGSYTVSSGHVINAGEGDDTIYSTNSGGATVLGEEGNDYIFTRNSYGTIDTIRTDGRWSSKVTSSYADYATISGGAGADVISLNGGSQGVTVNGGTGNDVIVVFNDSDTLIVDGAKYSTVKNENDVIVTIKDNSITLKDAADVSLNIIAINAEEQAA